MYRLLQFRAQHRLQYSIMDWPSAGRSTGSQAHFFYYYFYFYGNNFCINFKIFTTRSKNANAILTKMFLNLLKNVSAFRKKNVRDIL